MSTSIFTLLLFSLIVVSTIAVLVVVYAIRASRRASRALGVQLLQAFRMLVKHLQVHRGLTAAYLGGESVKDGLNREAQVIAHDVANITRLDAVVADHQDCLGITQHWARLSLTRYGADPYDTYQQHCKLVTACFAMMRWVAFHYRVHPYEKDGEKIYWYELLFLGEKLGQLRALGIMCLTLSQNSKVKKKGVQHVMAVLAEIEKIFHSKELQKKIGPVYSDEINNFLATVEHYVVGGDTWISTGSYFERATETIELIYKCFDEEMQRLLRSI